MPTRAKLQCLITDFVLQNGVANARTMLIDTDEARVGITGDVDLRSEKLDLAVKTEAKHFSIGSLPTPIDVNGTLGAPNLAPEVGPLAARGGAAIALGIIGTPLAALLPTIQFGTGEDNACGGLLRSVQTPPKVPQPAGQAARRRPPLSTAPGQALRVQPWQAIRRCGHGLGHARRRGRGRRRACAGWRGGGWPRPSGRRRHGPGTPA